MDRDFKNQLQTHISITTTVVNQHKIKIENAKIHLREFKRNSKNNNDHIYYKFEI